MRYLPFALVALTCLTALGQGQAHADVGLSPSAPPKPATAPAADAKPAAAAPAVANPAAAPAGAKPASIAETDANAPWIYLVTRIKLTGTDLTQVVFMRNPVVTTIEDCELERTAGLTTGWTRYLNKVYFKTLRGISYKVDYRCAQSEQHLRSWRQGDMQDQHYLVRTTNGKLQLERFRNFFACRDALLKTSPEETIDHFCGVGSQTFMPPATP